MIDGHLFDSIYESRRYGELKIMEHAGTIQELKIHPRFELQPAFDFHGEKIRALVYEADFSYFLNGIPIIEDVKGFETPAFKIKWKLLKFLFKDKPVLFVKYKNT